jgi:hypothetical protein
MEIITYIKNKPQQVSLSIALFFFILLGLFLRFEALDAVIVNEWVTRDFDRAFNLVDGNYIPLAGPEANNGGRLPGPFLYFLFAIPILFHYSYDSIFIFNLILNIASIGVLFFSLKKFFNLTFACIASALVCVNTFHISGVFFPINPSFIFLFVALFIWFFLEFTIAEKTIFFPLQVLTISLAIQIHYSMALLYLIPVVSIFVFKIKIPLKPLLLTISLCLACFTPFFFYKQFFYYPLIAGAAGSGLENLSLLKILSLFAIPNTIANITSNGSAQYWHSPIEIVSTISRTAIYVSILTLIYFTYSRYKKGDLISCKKPLAVFFIFYIPAFIYEVINPSLGHFWYAFIFVIPTILLVTQAGSTFFSLIENKILKSVFSIFIFSLLIFISHLSINHVDKGVKLVSGSVFRGTFEGSFKNYQNTLGKLMVALEMNPDQFAKKVYFLDARPSSVKRLEFAYSRLNEKQKNKIRNVNDDLCYFLFNAKPSRSQVKFAHLNHFLNDETIERLNQIIFNSNYLGIKRQLRGIPYKPKSNQFCYNNSFNSFVVDKEIRAILKEVKPIINKRAGMKHSFKTLFKKETYDSKNILTSFNGSYVVLNRMSKLPFKFNLTISKEINGYRVRSELISVYFWRNINVYLSKVFLKFLNKKYTTYSKNTNVEKSDVMILPSKTIASSVNNMGNVSDWSYNQFWFSETIIPFEDIEFKKDKFIIGLFSQFIWDESQNCCMFFTENQIMIPLNN